MQPPQLNQPEFVRWWRASVASLFLLGFAVICCRPYGGWACYPSLFDDDLTRVGDLRRSTLAGSLLRPFNEHVAPLFEVVGWLAWCGVGRRVEAIATGFLVASYLAWVATVIGVGMVVGVELRSALAALLAVALFAQSPLVAETVLWYSASSFQWAAAAGLATWYAAVLAVRGEQREKRRGWLIAAALGALASPLFSAIGVLAGPLATLRILAGRSGSGQGGESLPAGRSRIGAALIPLLGTAAYGLLVLAVPSGGGAVAASVRQNLDPGAALWAAARAPSAVLLPALLGLPPLLDWLPDPVIAALTGGIIGGVLVWTWRSPVRGPIITALGWVAGGYLLAYATRAQAGDRWIFEVGRYHLFPLIGAVCGTAALTGPILVRITARTPLVGWGAITLIATLGMIRSGEQVDALAQRTFRYPDQAGPIAAGLRLETICRKQQVSFAQVIRIIDPVEPRYFPRPLPFHPLIALFGRTVATETSQPDAQVRSAVLAALTPAEREAIFGGLDAARYRRTGAGTDQTPSTIHLRPTMRGVEERIGEGRLFFDEFVLPEGVADPTTLNLEGVTPGIRVEIWWAGNNPVWSAGRSVRWSVAPGVSHPLALADLPHWRVDWIRRFRVVRRRWPLPTTERPGLIISCAK